MFEFALFSVTFVFIFTIMIIFAPLSLPSPGFLVSFLLHQLEMEILVWFLELCFAALFFCFCFCFFFFFFSFLAFRLVWSCRPSVGPSPRHIIGLMMPANHNRVPAGLGLRPACMHSFFVSVFFSFCSVLFLFGLFLHFFALFVKRYFLVLFFGCRHVPRLCSWHYLAASDTGSCIVFIRGTILVRSVLLRDVWK